MEPLGNYRQMPNNIVLFFLLVCFNAAEIACLPNNPYSTQPLASRWLRQFLPATLQPPAASPRPQNSAPTAKSPSPPSFSSSFFPPLLADSSKTNPQITLFTQPLQLSAASLPPVAAVDPFVKQLCNNTDHSDVCISSVIPFLSARGKTSVDASVMLRMLIKACSIHAEMALAVASKLSTETNDGHGTAMAIMDCKEMYSDVLDGLQTAMNAITNKDMGTINSMLSGVISDAVTCDDGFEGQKSPLGDVDDKLRKMGSNCLAMASLIQW
ncbi:pectinesterase inhibitor [Argentina anserina]|uniref:pectinesterase inhibitor n=1 Tax=Argentina anserina TaxID=57926 RepID=UPI0021767A4B|nr:pectinesterase inhibitor [Potentilla anserina]